MARAVELSVIVPCFDEEANVAELVRRVLATFEAGRIQGELLLVDDGSRDGTAAAIRAAADAFPNVVGLFHAENRGIAAAWSTGAEAASGTLVAILDADLQYQPEDLLTLRRVLLESGVDLVQGFRSTVGRERDARYHLSRGFNTLLNAAFGMTLEDNKSGFVMCPREVLRDVLRHEGSYRYFQSFILVAAHAKGYRYREVETLFLPRRAGRSFLDGTAHRVAAESMVDLGRALLEYGAASRQRRPETAAPRPRLAEPAEEQARPRAVPKSRALAWKSYLSVFDRTHWTIRRSVEERYEALERTQWSSPGEIREIQNDALRRLVAHAHANVPYYRHAMQRAKIHPSDVKTTADLRLLPFLTKSIVRERLFLDLLARGHEKSEMLRVRTSGSTGEPFACYVDRGQLELRWAATLRSQGWTGYRFGDPSVRLWHQTLGLSASQAMKERLDAALLRRKFVPVFELREELLGDVLHEIAAHDPVLLDGYAEALDFLADYAEKRGAPRVQPRAVMSSAQTLTAESRARIERAFGCPVFDKYGAREFSGIAYECEAHGGHHVVAEGFVVEILKGGEPARPGEIGEVVVTDLTNRCMPFIRYRIGDLAVQSDPDEPCACGRGLPRIGAIEGRIQSIIQGEDGRFLPGTFFSHYLKDFDHAILRYQIEQTERGAVTFRIVPGGRLTEPVLEEIVATFRRHLGEGMRIAVERVPRIELSRTGKHLASVSRVPIDFQKVGLGS